MILNSIEWGIPSKNKNDGNKKKILFLHGLGGLAQLWRPLAAGLEEKYHILALDQRGHGKSTVDTNELKLENFHPKKYAEDIVETLEKLNFFPCLTVGHSMGVRTSLFSCYKKPEYFYGMILIDLGLSGPAGGGLGEKLSQFLSLLPDEFKSREEARQYLNHYCPDHSITQYLIAVLQKNNNQNLVFPFNKEALLLTIEAAKKADSENVLLELAQKNKPCLLLRGEQSTVWSKAQFEAEKNMFSSFPLIQFEEMKNCGHGLPFEKRQEFTLRLEKFILDLPI